CDLLRSSAASLLASAALRGRRPDLSRRRLVGRPGARGGGRTAHAGAGRSPEPVPGHGSRRNDPRAPASRRRSGAAGGHRPRDAEVRRMSMRINLLPHREMRRERRKKDFVGLIALGGIAAAATAVVAAVGIDQRFDSQRARNDFIRAENAKLDEQIKEIATLRAEIDSLRARQYAVESLQTNRTIPVHLMDELVKHTP